MEGLESERNLKMKRVVLYFVAISFILCMNTAFSVFVHDGMECSVRCICCKNECVLS